MFSSARQPSSRETAASIGVLVVLVAITGWLLNAQRHFSPAVTVSIAAAQAATQSPADATAVPASRSPELAPPAAAPGPEHARDLLTTWPAGLRPMSAAEAFTADTLSDKIDGKAELYLSAGVAGLRCQRVTSAAAGSEAAPAPATAGWFEAFVYDMGTPANAFAVYSSQKRTAAKEAGIGDYSYLAGNQLCVVHGRYYLELVGADETGATMAGSAAVARAFIAATPVTRHANVARDEALFPSAGGPPASVMLMSADVFGFDQLTNTYVARYAEGADTVALFLTRRASEAEAAKLAAAVRGFFVTDCGGTELPTAGLPAGAVVVDEGGTFDAVFARGAIVAGVHQAPTREAAERWLRRLGASLEAATP